MVALAEQPITPDDAQRLVTLFEVGRSPFSLARATDIPIHTILDWIARPDIQAHIDRIMALEDSAERQIDRTHRAAMIDMLRALAAESDDPVEKRRAAIAVLRATSPRRPLALQRARGSAEPRASQRPQAAPDHPAPDTKPAFVPDTDEPLPPIPPDPGYRRFWIFGPHCPSREDVFRYITSSPDNLAHWQTAAIDALKHRTPADIFRAIYDSLHHPIMCGGRARSGFEAQLAASPLVSTDNCAFECAPARIDGNNAVVALTATTPGRPPRTCTLHYIFSAPFPTATPAWSLIKIDTS